jgi:energy-coupling factor transporter ATP-binding protein EcfA2
MPFIRNDKNNWNQRWDDDINYEGNGFTQIDEVMVDDEIEIVKYNIPEKQKEEPKPVEKEPAFHTNGKIPIVRDPYEPKEYIYTKKEFEFKPGVTVLVGCNGCGKTTLLHQIKDYLKSKKVPVVSFDNLHDGGSNARSEAAAMNDFTFLATASFSSEGENIVMNVGRLARTLRTFIQTGESQNRGDRLCKAFARAVWGDQDEPEVPNERWILLDAIDSGLSVDNIVDIKELLFKTIIEDSEAQGIKTFLIVSANEYEICRNEQCMDVHTGKYRTFSGYESYRKFVLKSREIKNKRYDNQEK